MKPASIPCLLSFLLLKISLVKSDSSLRWSPSLRSLSIFPASDPTCSTGTPYFVIDSVPAPSQYALQSEWNADISSGPATQLHGQYLYSSETSVDSVVPRLASSASYLLLLHYGNLECDELRPYKVEAVVTGTCVQVRRDLGTPGSAGAYVKASCTTGGLCTFTVYQDKNCVSKSIYAEVPDAIVEAEKCFKNSMNRYFKFVQRQTNGASELTVPLSTGAQVRLGYAVAEVTVYPQGTRCTGKYLRKFTRLEPNCPSDDDQFVDSTDCLDTLPVGTVQPSNNNNYRYRCLRVGLVKPASFQNYQNALSLSADDPDVVFTRIRSFRGPGCQLLNMESDELVPESSIPTENTAFCLNGEVVWKNATHLTLRRFTRAPNTLLADCTGFAPVHVPIIVPFEQYGICQTASNSLMSVVIETVSVPEILQEAQIVIKS